MFTWKRNVALHLAQTRLPKSVYEYIDLGSEIFDLPPPYKTTEATIVATPEIKKDPEARGRYWIDSPGGEAIKRLCFTEDGTLLEKASVGTVARRAAPCKITASVRKSLEQHCYVQVVRFVDLKEYNYILTSAAVKFGAFPCSDAGIARCCVFGSRLLPQGFKKRRQGVEIRSAVESPAVAREVR
jgi:hypothetical protein